MNGLTFEQAEAAFEAAIEAAQDVPGGGESAEAEAVAVLRSKVNSFLGTDNFKSNIEAHMKELCSDEMRAHAFADRTHDLDFQIFRILTGYQEALDKLAAYKKEVSSLICKINRVTAYHRHGQRVPVSYLDDLSNAQVEFEHLMRED